MSVHARRRPRLRWLALPREAARFRCGRGGALRASRGLMTGLRVVCLHGARMRTHLMTSTGLWRLAFDRCVKVEIKPQATAVVPNCRIAKHLSFLDAALV